MPIVLFFFFNDTATTEIYTLSLHDALPISAENAEEPVKEESAEDVTEEVEVPDDGNEPAIVEPEEEPEVKEEPKKEEYVNISNPEDNEIYDAPKKPSTDRKSVV